MERYLANGKPQLSMQKIILQARTCVRISSQIEQSAKESFSNLAF